MLRVPWKERKTNAWILEMMLMGKQPTNGHNPRTEGQRVRGRSSAVLLDDVKMLAGDAGLAFVADDAAHISTL